MRRITVFIVASGLALAAGPVLAQGAAAVLAPGSAAGTVLGAPPGIIAPGGPVGINPVGQPVIPDVAFPATLPEASGRPDLGSPPAPPSAGVVAQTATGSNVSANIAGLYTGMSVNAANGENLGQVVDMSRDAGGQVTGVTVLTHDGKRHTLPAGRLKVRGAEAMTTLTQAEVESLPQTQ